MNKKLFLIYLMEVHSGIWFEDYTQESAIEFVFDVELCTVHDYYSIGYKCMYVLRRIKIMLRYVMNKEAQRRTPFTFIPGSYTVELLFKTSPYMILCFHAILRLATFLKTDRRVNIIWCVIALSFVIVGKQLAIVQKPKMCFFSLNLLTKHIQIYYTDI